MTTDYPLWCHALKSEEWYKGTEVDILESYLTESITTSEAAEKLTAYTDRRSTAESKVGRIWTMLQLCADECFDAHEMLIDLIKALITIPASKETGGVDWRDQETSFKELWRDSYDSLHASLQEKTNYQNVSSVPLPQKWINFHAFTASLATSGIFRNDFGIASGLTVIVEALEKKSPVSLDLETNLPAAGHWFLRAGHNIFRDGTSMGILWGEGSDLWKGKEGFSRDRWNFWKERLEKIQGSEVVSEEAREIARKAYVAMGKVERAKK